MPKAPTRRRSGRPREHPTPAKFGPVRIRPELYDQWTLHMAENEPYTSYRQFFERAIERELRDPQPHGGTRATVKTSRNTSSG